MHIVGVRYNDTISVLIYSNIVKCFIEILKSDGDGFGCCQCIFGTGKENIIKTILSHDKNPTWL